MTQKNEQVYKKKKTTHKTAVLFWVCLILVILPFAILGWILFSASRDTHSPVLGRRYDGDLDPAITSSQMDEVKNAVSAVDGVDSADVEMQTATLRVYADIADTASADDANSIADALYSAVTSVLDPNTYFSQSNGEKMYDLEIHVYTIPERTGADGENFVYVIDTKTSNMTDPQKQLVSEPINADLAQQLRDDVTARKAEEDAEANSNTDAGAGTDAGTPDGTSDQSTQQ